MSNNLDLYNNLKLLKVIPDNRLEECLSEAELQHRDLHTVILDHDLLSDENIGKIKADLYNTLYVHLNIGSLKREIAELIPLSFAKKYECLPISQTKNGIVTIACSDPTNPTLLNRLNTRFQQNYNTVYSTSRNIKNMLKVYADDAKTIFDNLLKGNIDIAQKETSDPPIIQIVDTILRFAYESLASDIHLEPTIKESLIRFRIDGVMHDVVSLPKDIHPRIVTRIKVMSSLRTDENKASQDGKFDLSLNDERIDIRVSLVPTVNGESVVMRLLSAKSRQFSLLDLGLSESDAAKLETARKKPHGMILATGPTGSGKTTTLYALLKLLNSRGVNIMTIEDPVEYEISGINQILVNKTTDLTFADGLRSIVRQDPDIILVGEIRDNETAGIAVNSAMTGHLVLSTLHTNDAATSIPRLIDMKIEPFLIATTVNVIIAQRLVRKICTECRYSQEISSKELTKLLSKDLVAKHFGTDKTRIYQAKGCPACQNRGYTGRVGIFELLTISDSIREAIVAKKDANIIQELAIKEGMTTMLEDGLLKVKAGITTIEEVLRVTKE